jgi:hypothetical protein
MDPISRTQSEMIAQMEKIIVEQNRRLMQAERRIAELKREIEVGDELLAHQIERIVKEYEEQITVLLTPSLN